MTLNKESLFKFHENMQPVVFESTYVTYGIVAVVCVTPKLGGIRET